MECLTQLKHYLSMEVNNFTNDEINSIRKIYLNYNPELPLYKQSISYFGSGELEHTLSEADGKYKVGDLVAAEKNYNNALNILKESSGIAVLHYVSWILYGLGSIKYVQDDYQSAYQLYSRSLRLRNKLRNKYGIKYPAIEMSVYATEIKFLATKLSFLSTVTSDWLDKVKAICRSGPQNLDSRISGFCRV